MSFLTNLIHTVRKVLLPCLVRAATTVLLLTASDGDLSAINVLLNILAITFVCEMDEMISFIVIQRVAWVPTCAPRSTESVTRASVRMKAMH